MGRYGVKTTIEEGRERVKSNYMEYPIGEADFPSIQKTDKGRIYSRISTIDRDFRAKCIANKYLYTKYYTILHLWMAYTVNTLCNTLL